MRRTESVETNTAQQLLKVIENETGAAEVPFSTRIDALVDDSLEFLSLVCAVENAFGFKIPDKQYAEVQTVEDLLSFIPDHIPS